MRIAMVSTVPVGDQGGVAVSDRGGPYLNAALICERVLRETDGVASAIRIVDRFTSNVQAVGMELPPLPGQRKVAFTLLLCFRSGKARGNETLTLEVERPDGMIRPFLSRSIYFDGDEEHGPMVSINVDFDYDQDGLYWFCVFLEDTFITKIPLRLLTSYQQLPAPPQTGPPR
jgi:hypothetical protein